MEEFGRLESSEKTIVILGDRWWPQTAKQGGDRIRKHDSQSLLGLVGFYFEKFLQDLAWHFRGGDGCLVAALPPNRRKTKKMYISCNRAGSCHDFVFVSPWRRC